MKSMKFPLIMLVVMLMVTAVVTPARADSALPEGYSAQELLSNMSSATVLPDDYTPAENLVLPDTPVPPYPLAPISASFIANKLPKLYFARNTSATAYKIYMYDFLAGGALLYTYVGGTENCGTSYCWLQPPTKLKTAKYDASSGGLYIWKVEAQIGGAWVSNTNTSSFTVLSTGFTSTFDTDTKKWEVINGDWTRTSSGYYKTVGAFSTNVNTWRRDIFLRDNLVIEARMKRKVETGSANRIYFLGSPNPLFATNKWQNGYNLIFYNDDSWLLVKNVSGTEDILAGGNTPYIEPLSWNTYKIWISGDNIYLWINDIFMGSYLDNGLGAGMVGLSSYEVNIDVSPLLVDYVKVYYSASMPQAITATGTSNAATDVVTGGGGDYLVK